MGIWDELADFMNSMNGQEIGGDIIYVYDEEHKRKVAELIAIDPSYLYLIQKKCGIDPFDEDDYYGPDNDIRIVNVDHFAIRASLKNRAEEFRKIVYDAIDYVYDHKDEIDLEDELGDYGNDDYDTDFDTSDFEDDED